MFPVYVQGVEYCYSKGAKEKKEKKKKKEIETLTRGVVKE